MTKKYFNFKNQAIALAAITILSFGCGSEEAVDTELEVVEEKDPNQNQLLAVDGKVFSIPSPIQTALLIKGVGVNYNKDMLNEPSKVTNYSTKFKKAINLGVYGADLGYVTLYNNTQDAISFLTAIKSIGDDLGVSEAFDVELVERFERNIDNQDSLLILISDAYKSSDRYLKSNEQNDLGGLILAGGWIESLYFTTNAASMSANQEVINRVAEQKTTLSNLVKILSPNYNNPEFAGLIDSLKELEAIYKEIENVYTYVKPSVDAANKTTTIKSTTKINISEEQLKAITEKVMQIRIQIIS